MNLDFASVWEMVADLVPENDALICGEEIVSWKDYDHRSSNCLLYTSPSPRDLSTSRMPSSA